LRKNRSRSLQGRFGSAAEAQAYTVAERISLRFHAHIAFAELPYRGRSSDRATGTARRECVEPLDRRRFPSINFSDGTGFAPIGRDIVGPTLSSTNQIADSINYTWKNHTFRGGVDVRWVRFAVPEIETPSDDYGLFTFNQNVFTGSALGDFLLRLPNTTYFAVTGPRDDAGTPQTGLYLSAANEQDSG
jgi:hypothetical protein